MRTRLLRSEFGDALAEVGIECLEDAQAVSRRVARARECPPIPTCTRLAPAEVSRSRHLKQHTIAIAGLSGNPLRDSNPGPPPYHFGADGCGGLHLAADPAE